MESMLITTRCRDRKAAHPWGPNCDAPSRLAISKLSPTLRMRALPYRRRCDTNCQRKLHPAIPARHGTSEGCTRHRGILHRSQGPAWRRKTTQGPDRHVVSRDQLRPYDGRTEPTWTIDLKRGKTDICDLLRPAGKPRIIRENARDRTQKDYD